MRPIPPVRSTAPQIMNALYLPVREMIAPEIVDDSSTPAIIGIVMRPDSVGVLPRASCMYWLRNTDVPNIAMPTATLATTDSTSVRLRNSPSGMIGSSTRDSTHSAAASVTTEAPSIAKVCHDAQANLSPANVTHSRSSAMPTDRSAAPQ